jgi:hypothetical protein
MKILNFNRLESVKWFVRGLGQLDLRHIIRMGRMNFYFHAVQCDHNLLTDKYFLVFLRWSWRCHWQWLIGQMWPTVWSYWHRFWTFSFTTKSLIHQCLYCFVLYAHWPFSAFGRIKILFMKQLICRHFGSWILQWRSWAVARRGANSTRTN